MPAGYRITEGSDSRILESGDVRVTEGFQTGEVGLTSSSGFDFLGQLDAKAATSLAANASLVVSGDVIRYGATLVANNSTLDAEGNRITSGELSASAAGSAVFDADLVANAAFAASSSGTLSATARVVKYVEVVSGNAQFLRILESEDYRVTESGDNRITNAVPTNEIIGSMVADEIFIPFSSTAYYKTGGVWKQTDVDAQYNNDWNALQAVYKKISGNWKRIY